MTHQAHATTTTRPLLVYVTMTVPNLPNPKTCTRYANPNPPVVGWLGRHGLCACEPSSACDPAAGPASWHEQRPPALLAAGGVSDAHGRAALLMP